MIQNSTKEAHLHYTVGTFSSIEFNIQLTGLIHTGWTNVPRLHTCLRLPREVYCTIPMHTAKHATRYIPHACTFVNQSACTTAQAAAAQTLTNRWPKKNLLGLWVWVRPPWTSSKQNATLSSHLAAERAPSARLPPRSNPCLVAILGDCSDHS